MQITFKIIQEKVSISLGDLPTTYKVNGIKDPTLVRWTKSGIVTGGILKDMLKAFDDPTVMIDTHQSCFKVEFLKYGYDSYHCWNAVIGLPYATHK